MDEVARLLDISVKPIEELEIIEVEFMKEFKPFRMSLNGVDCTNDGTLGSQRETNREYENLRKEIASDRFCPLIMKRMASPSGIFCNTSSIEIVMPSRVAKARTR